MESLDLRIASRLWLWPCIPDTSLNFYFGARYTQCPRCDKLLRFDCNEIICSLWIELYFQTVLQVQFQSFNVETNFKMSKWKPYQTKSCSLAWNKCPLRTVSFLLKYPDIELCIERTWICNISLTCSFQCGFQRGEPRAVAGRGGWCNTQWAGEGTASRGQFSNPLGRRGLSTTWTTFKSRGAKKQKTKSQKLYVGYWYPGNKVEIANETLSKNRRHGEEKL